MHKLLYILFAFFISYSYYAQVPADSSDFTPRFKRGISYTVKTRNGSLYSGFVKEETKEFVTLENRLKRETVELRKSEIIRITQGKGRDLNAEIMGENLHAENYLFLTSAFLFEEGKASSNSHWLLLENLDYAFSENWAISLNTLAFYPITLGVKYVCKISDNNYVGANIFGIGDIASGSNSNFLFGYGAQGKLTTGTSNKNLTVSGGVLGLSSNIFYASPTQAFVNLGFVGAAYCNRFSKKVALNLEGWYLPETATGLGGLGFKFVGNEYSCWTVGCYTLINSFDNTLRINFRTLPIPYFGVSRRFN